MMKDVVAVEFGDGETKLAILQLAIQIVRAHQEVGPMQGDAEADIEHTRRDHCAPRSKIAVMNVDVANAFRPQTHC